MPHSHTKHLHTPIQKFKWTHTHTNKHAPKEELTQTLIPEGSKSLAVLPLWNCYCHLYPFPRAAGTNYHKPGGLKTTKIYFVTVLEARSLKSMHQQGGFLLEVLRENPSHATLLVLPGLLQVFAQHPPTPTFSKS